MGRKYFYSFGSNRSRGVGILVSGQLEYKLVSQFHDYEGRLIYLDLDVGDNKFRFINIYLPNNALERKAFLRSLDTHLITSRSIVLGGV